MVIGFLFILGCLVALYYFLFYRTEYSAPVTTVPLTTQPATTTAVASGKTTYVGTVTSDFEEVSRISFQFTYPAAALAVTASNDGKNVSITEKASTSTPLVHKVTVSFEGGRGYSPADYWTNVAKKTCTGCTKVDAPFVVAAATSTVAYANAQKTVYIVQGTQADWLFVFELMQPDDEIIAALSTFSFK